MSPRITFATAVRVIAQLRRDPRTIALLLAVPLLLMGLLAWLLSARPADFDRYGAPLLGIFPLIVMFLVTSVATLRERSSGTLERLLTMPMAKADFVFGYALAFGVLAVVQTAVVCLASFRLFGLTTSGSPWAVVLVALLDALLGTALGLFVSAFANTEFQAVQFMPMTLIPQLLLCGIVVQRSAMPRFLQLVSDVLPLSYAIDALQHVSWSADLGQPFWTDIAVVLGFVAAALVAGSTTLRRRTA